jgi:hypothetical protein
MHRHSILLASLLGLCTHAVAQTAAAQTAAQIIASASDFDKDLAPGARAYFSRRAATLWVDGADGDDVIELSVAADGSLLVNGGDVPIDGGLASLATTRAIVVDGGDGHDVLIDATGLGAELRGGWGMDLLLWDDSGALGVSHTFSGGDERDFDLYLVNAPAHALGDDVWVEGSIITAESYDASASVGYFNGRFLSARDLASDQSAVAEGRILVGALYDAAGNDAYVDGPIVVGAPDADDVVLDGKIITADAWGTTTLTVRQVAGRRVIDVRSLP